MRPSKQLLQAYAVMDFTFESLQAMKESLTQDGRLRLTREDCLALKALVSAWEAAQHRVSFHRRVGSPAPDRPQARSRKQVALNPAPVMTIG